jgi:hypothetical protein
MVMMVDVGASIRCFVCQLSRSQVAFHPIILHFLFFFKDFFLLKDNREFIRICRNILFFRLESSNLFNYLTNMCWSCPWWVLMLGGYKEISIYHWFGFSYSSICYPLIICYEEGPCITIQLHNTFKLYSK